MRHHRREQPHEYVGCLAQRPAHVVADRRRVDVSERRGQAVAEIVDLRHRAVEAQALDILADLDQRIMRRLADDDGGGPEFLRRCGVGWGCDFGEIIDEAPHALDEFRRCLGALLGPFRVSVGHRQGAVRHSM